MSLPPVSQNLFTTEKIRITLDTKNAKIAVVDAASTYPTREHYKSELGYNIGQKTAEHVKPN